MVNDRRQETFLLVDINQTNTDGIIVEDFDLDDRFR